MLPAPHFLLLTPGRLGYPGFSVLWTFINSHPFELSLPFTVRTELLIYGFEQSLQWEVKPTLNGEIFSLKESDSTPGSSAPAPSLFVLYSCSLGEACAWSVFHCKARTYLACRLLPGLPWEPVGPVPCSMSLSLNWRLLVPLQCNLVELKSTTKRRSWNKLTLSHLSLLRSPTLSTLLLLSSLTFWPASWSSRLLRLQCLAIQLFVKVRNGIPAINIKKEVFSSVYQIAGRLATPFPGFSSWNSRPSNRSEVKALIFFQVPKKCIY